LFSENKNKQNTKLKMQTIMQTIIEELCAPVIQELANQYANRIIDHHLGEYVLEEGEIIDEEWSLEDMQLVAKRIVMGGIANTKEPIVTTYDEVYGPRSI
jgi:hypothetical protein